LFLLLLTLYSMIIVGIMFLVYFAAEAR